MEEQLLKAKLALVKMIHQFMYTREINGEEYYDNYCESAGEFAFSTLGIEENIIKVESLWKMQDDIQKELWKIIFPDEEYKSNICLLRTVENLNKY